VLLSGGLDSATCLYLAKKQGLRAFCLIFDYGQRHRKEIVSAKRIARAAGAKFLVCKINFPWKGSSLLNAKERIPGKVRGIPSTYVPGRNIIFLSFALSYAETLKGSAIFIGANARDFAGYPDCRPDFYRSFREVAKTGLKRKGIRVLTPLLHKTKAEIVKLASSLGVPFELTWSCYRGGKGPCGRCSSCCFRAKGFREAGVKDPTICKKLR